MLEKNMTVIEKTLISLSALISSAREGLKTHKERDIADWLFDRLENEINILDYELNHGEYKEESSEVDNII